MRHRSSECRKTALALALALAATASLVASERAAFASDVLEFPDNGSEQLARGGAWVARASDPLAAFYNPAGLAGQKTAVLINANIAFQHTCFTRIKAAGDTTQEPLADPNGNFPRVCNDVKPFLNPQIAATIHVSDRVGIGLAVLGPSGVGAGTWPDFASGQPSPNRYLLLDGNLFEITPTIGIGGEVVDRLRLGASLQWGIMKAKFTQASPALNQENQTPQDNDVATTLIVHDYFVPGFTLGALWSPADTLDIAGWYKWSDSIRARGDAYTQAGYFSKKNANGDSSGIIDGDTSLKDCNMGDGSTTCGNGGNASLKMAQPMEAKIGFRYHQPRAGVDQAHLRDPIATDTFDAELDLTWANNSVVDDLEVRFPGDAQGNGVIPVHGISGGTIPPNADVPRKYKDVFGVRAGGDVNVLPDQLALRAGAFFESRGQDPHYQNLDFIGGERFGLALGGTYRIRMGNDEDRMKRSALELHLGFMHMFAATQQNDDPNGYGINATSGTPCNPAANGAQAGGNCSDGRQKYRTNWPVNLGTITNALNVINVGATYRF